MTGEKTELSAAKQLLLEKRLQGALRNTVREPVITRGTHGGRAPLSFAQQRLWFLEQLAPGSPVYNIIELLRLRGPLDVPALERGLQEILRRHEALRTTFIAVDGQPVQVIAPPADFRIELVDLRVLSPLEREAETRRVCAAEEQRPFDLTRDLMMRATLVRLTATEHVLLLVMHHIASDAWSIGVLYQELSKYYQAFTQGQTTTLAEPPIQYSDYAVWQRDWMQGKILERELAYWKEQLAGAPETLNLPADRPRPARQTFRGTRKTLALPEGLSRELKELSHRHGVTFFMTLLTAFKALLHRYTRQNDIVVDSPIAGRNRMETEALIGFFVNTLILRTRLNPEMTFADLLGQVRKVTLEAYAHQELPFEKLVEHLQPERSLSMTPFVQTMFVVQDGLSQDLRLPGITVTSMDAENGTAKFDLMLTVFDQQGNLSASIEYNTDIYDAPTIGRMLAHYQTLLEAVVKNPAQRLSALPLMSDAERHQVLRDWNNTNIDYPRDIPVHRLFEKQAASSPAACAIIDGGLRLNYGQLNARANRLARSLQRAGVVPGAFVGLYLERSADLLVTLLAILKAGGAYVPLDQSYPKDRIRFMLEDAQVPVLVTESRLVSALPGQTGAKLFCLDREASTIEAQSPDNLSIDVSSDAPAYVIYTSGSTGQPKGVTVPHRAINRLVLNTNYAPLGRDDVMAQVSNSSFDAATWEIWGSFLNGGRLVIVPKEVALSADDFAAAIREQGVTAMFLTTALFNQHASHSPRMFQTVRHLLVGGEALEARWVREVLQHGAPRRFLNVYGPTETTTFATWLEIRQLPDSAVSAPIGRPIANTTTYILDEQRQPVPIGIQGELYIGGDGVALGYLNRPELTRERFIQDPFSTDPNARLYRTGDLVRYLDSGLIEFLGRIDQQVKIRGFRVELGEIEAVLGEHAAVRQGAVAARSDGSGPKRLVAYLVPKNGSLPDAAELRAYLGERLPEYAIPSFFVSIPELPLSPNGKVNRAALPEPEGARGDSAAPLVAPADHVERKLQTIWQNVLGVPEIGTRNKFFELGGHSLLAVRLVAQIEKVFGTKLSVATIFQCPTIAQLATVLRDGRGVAPSSSVVEIQPKGTRPPIFFVHGVGGGMFWGYTNLARHLGADQPVYAFRSLAMDGREEFSSIEEMAAQYVSDLRAFQPKGPYFLGGYCFGGNVAYEVARLLEEQGEKVGMLALINSGPPNSSYTQVRWSPSLALKFSRNLIYWMRYVATWGPKQRRNFIRWKLVMLGKAIGRRFTRAAHQEADEVDNWVDLAAYPQGDRPLWGAHIRSLMRYRPKPCDGVVTLFRSAGHPFLCSFDSRYGWGDFAMGGVDVHVVSGYHESILEEPHVAHLAREMGSALRKAQAIHEPRSAPPTPPPPMPRQTDDSSGPVCQPNLAEAPLTLAQKALWELGPGHANVSACLALDGELDFSALDESLREVIRRHAALRTRFVNKGTTMHGEVAPAADITLEQIQTDEASLTGQIEAAVTRRFDLSTAPQLRATLFRTAETKHVLLLAMPALAADEMSLHLLQAEIAELYSAKRTARAPKLPELPLQYGDFAVWQRARAEQQAIKNGEAAVGPDLTTDRPLRSRRSWRARVETLVLPRTLLDALKKLSHREAITLFLTIMAATGSLMYRQSRLESFALGTSVSGRARSDIRNLIGLFSNVWLLKQDFSGNPTFREVLQRCRQAVDNPRTGFVKTGLRALVSLENSRDTAASWSGLGVREFQSPIKYVPYDLGFQFVESGQDLRVECTYSIDLFESVSVRRWLARLQHVLEAVVADPDQRVSDLPLLPESERFELLQQWNATDAEFPLDQDYPALFEARVAANPNAIAVRYRQQQWTYAELNRRANKIAHHLRQLGVGAETLIGIYMERSLEVASALLGVLKAGAAYLPLDPDYPQERLDYMITDSRASVLLAQSRLLPRLAAHDVATLAVDDPAFLAGIDVPGSDLNPSPLAAPGNLAYVIYTSGSTGKSKGVEITRRSLLNHNLAMARTFALAPADRVLQFTALSFDVSVEELLPSWLSGCAVVMRTEEVLASVAQFFRFVESEQISVLNLPTAFWHAVVDSLPGVVIPKCVRLVVIGGEKPSLEHYRSWQQNVGARVKLINAYGLTETTITNTVYEGRADAPADSLPIGKPIANTHTYILDPMLEPVPIGMPGELYIGGEGVARGYLNRPDLTAERFLSDPFRARSNRLYRTGDRARFLPDGNIEFVGRMDDQIKLRGFRIDPAEVEDALHQHSAVQQAVVAARGQGHDDKRLIAWFVPASPTPPSPAELTSFLKGKLPGYMVPSAFVALESLPLQPTGKVDRNALPAPAPARPKHLAAFVAPGTPIERQVAAIWSEVLGIEDIGMHDNFFDLGGNSIHAMQVIARLREHFVGDVSFADLFQTPTIAALVGVLATMRRRRANSIGPVVPVQRDGNAPLSFAQQRLWFLHQFDPASAVYNLPHTVRIRGQLDVAALVGAMREVLSRHEALRTHFIAIDGEARQRVASPQSFDLPITDLSTRSHSDAEIQRVIDEEARAPFDLGRDFMLRAKLLRLSETEHVLLVTFHHVACDGWSIEVFWEEFFAAYESLASGRSVELPALPVQYIDYSEWQRGWLAGDTLKQQLDYWKGQLAGAPALLELPTDRPRSASQSSAGKRCPVRFSPLLTTGLKTLSKQQNCTLFMTVLAGFNALLARYAGSDDIVIGTVVANRPRSEIEPLIGFFANTLVLRTDLSGDPTFREALERTRKITLDAYAHQDVPFEKLVEELHPVRDRSYHPLFQVALVLQNVPARDHAKLPLEVDIAECDTGSALFDLTLHLSETGETLAGYLQYSTDLFDENTIARMVRHLESLLESAVRSPDTRISGLRLLGAGEREQLLVEWNRTAAEYPKDLTWVQLFEAQAAHTPQAIALVCGEERLSYEQLNARVNQLAQHLRQLGVGPESLAGVCMERSTQMVIAIMAVLKAGGAYLPMDPAYPAERLAFMLEDARVSVLLTQTSLQREWPANTRVLHLDTLDLRGESANNPEALTQPENLAYVIYTSGSTGRPKGVAIEHRSLNAFAHWAKDLYTVEELSGVLAGTSICFDLSIFELLVPVCWGGKIILARNILQLPELPAAGEVRLLNTVPSAAAELLRIQAIPPAVRAINLAGEPLRQTLVDQLYALGTLDKVYDLYGPTEDTVYSTCALRQPHGRATIGRPLANKQIYILDDQMEPVPVGVVGQLYIGGDGLARGYLQRPDLTSERFIPNPSGSRVYKTGDLARYQWDGQIEFIGRADHQVKIRGFRIELGEVETQLRQHAGVREAVVLAREEEGGEKRLVGYVVGDGLSAAQLKENLKKRLPDYMVPSAIVLLDKLPLTPNGKVDRKALPAPEASSAPADEFAPPQSDLERLLAGMWCEVLGVTRVGCHDNFFELGGHSLMVTKLISRVREGIQVELPMAAVFEAPTIAGLAVAIEDILIQEIDGLTDEEAEKLDQTLVR